MTGTGSPPRRKIKVPPFPGASIIAEAEAREKERQAQTAEQSVPEAPLPAPAAPVRAGEIIVEAKEAGFPWWAAVGGFIAGFAAAKILQLVSAGSL